MTHGKRWTAQVFIDEHRTSAALARRCDCGHRDRTGPIGVGVGVGVARRNPRDPDVPEIGDELAVSRVLSELARRLLDAAAGDIDALTESRAWRR
jgi:hypothetical protein